MTTLEEEIIIEGGFSIEEEDEEDLEDLDIGFNDLEEIEEMEQDENLGHRLVTSDPSLDGDSDYFFNELYFEK